MKYAKIDGVWKPITEEYAKVGGAWKPATINYPKVDGDWKPIPFEKFIFICEDFSSRLYALDDTPVIADGWPLYGSDGAETIDSPLDVACDRQSTSYWACGNGLYKVAKDGTIDWRHDMTAAYRVNVVAVDAAFNVYGGDGAGIIQMLDSSKSSQWTYDASPNIPYCVAVDHDGGIVYTGIGTTNKRILQSVRSTGTTSIYLTTTAYGTPTGLDIVSGTPDLIIGTSDGYVLRYNATEGYVWGDDGVLGTGAAIQDVCVGHDGYVYASTTDGAVYKLRYSDGGQEWSYSATGCANSVAVDVSGYVYASWCVVGSTTTNNCVRKLDQDGNVVWTWRPYTAAQMYGVAVTPGLPSAGF